MENFRRGKRFMKRKTCETIIHALRETPIHNIDTQVPREANLGVECCYSREKSLLGCSE